MSTPYPMPRAPSPPKPGLLARIQGIFQSWFGTKKALQGDGTTQTAYQNESPSTFQQQMVQLEYDRQSIVQDVRRLIDDDPRIAQSNKDIARDAAGTGLRVKVGGIEGAPAAMVARAQDEVDRLFRDTDLNGTLRTMFAALLEDGDLFTSPIVRDDMVSRVQILPALTMERLDDDRGQFIDSDRAFRQVDINTREELATFPLWQVNHIRYDWRPNRGDKYGRAQYLQVRGHGKFLGMTENDLVIRRRTRAPQRYKHRIGTPESPGQEHEINTYKQVNGLNNPNGPRVTTDFYTNGKTDVDLLQGDSSLDQIGDVEHLNNTYFIGLVRPKGLMGYGEGINRDILDRQADEYHKWLSGLRDLMWNGDGGVYSGLKAMIDFALALAGINPALITYQPSWSLRLSKEQLEYIGTVNDLRVTGMISHQTALGLVGALLGIESAEAELVLLEQEKAKRQAAQDAEDRAFAAAQTGAAKRNREALEVDDEDDDDE